MLVTIYTPKNKLLSETEADSVYLPTLSGDLTILNNHNPIIGVLREGSIVVKQKDLSEINIALKTGYFEFSSNELKILIEKTNLTKEELLALEEKAKRAKNQKVGRKENIDEDEFEERNESEGF